MRETFGIKRAHASKVDWPDNNHRLFVGNLSKDVTDEILAQHFSHYPSFANAQVIRDKYTKGPRGYGFVSFSEVTDFSRALKEMEWTYIFNRPCKISKSTYGRKDYSTKESSKHENIIKYEIFQNNCHTGLSKVKYSSKKKKKNHIGGVPNF